jgi:hypothetical protein
VVRRPVRAERTHRISHPDRHHQQALHECRPICRHRDPGIGIDVADDDGLPVQDRPPRDAGIGGEAPPLPEGADRVLVGVEDLLTFTKHEGDAVGAEQLARCSLHDVRDTSDLTERGQISRECE